MATDKLFTVCGTSKLDGETKVRFANDVMRVKVLDKHGHKDVVLVELPNAMTKLEAVKFIQSLDEFSGADAQSAIADYLDSKAEKAPKVKVEKAPKAKVEKAPKAKAPKVAATTVDEADDDKPIGYDQLVESVGEALL